MNSAKMDFCKGCLFDAHETIGCTAQQLKWAVEDLKMQIPIVGEYYSKQGHSDCPFFEFLDEQKQDKEK